MSFELIPNSPFTLYSIAPGKPDSNVPWKEGEVRPLIEAPNHKGNTCLFYAANMVRQRIGKHPPPGYEEARTIEKNCSLLRKSLTKLEMSYDYQNIHYLTSKCTDNPTPEVIKKILPFLEFSMIPDVLSSYQRFIESNPELRGNPSAVLNMKSKVAFSLKLLKNYSNQSKHNNLLSYYNEEHSKPLFRIYNQFFVKMQVDLKVYYENHNDGIVLLNHKSQMKMPLHEYAPLLAYSKQRVPVYESLTLEQKCKYATVCAQLFVRRAYGFKPSSWTPSQSIDELEEALKTHGPLLMAGFLGSSYYKKEAYFVKEVAGRSIYSWKKEDANPLNESEPLHAVIVIGTENVGTRGGFVYFQDPKDRRNPKKANKIPIYVNSFDNFKARLKPSVEVPLERSSFEEMFNSVMRASAFYYDPKKPPKDVTSIGVETALVSKEVCVDYDVGFGNTLGYRAAPEWDETILLTWTPKGWTGDICLGKEFKFVIVSSNGQIQWENRGENRTLDQNGEAKAMTLNGIQF